MSFWGKLNRTMATIHDIAVDDIGPKVGKVIEKAGKAIPKAVNTVAGGVNKTIIGTKDIIGKVKSGEIAEVGEKITKAILTDDQSYRRELMNIKGKKILWSNKPLVLDELNSEIRSLGDKAAGIFDLATRSSFEINGKNIPNIFQILKKDDTSLIGVRTNLRGKALAMGTALVVGVPAAGKEFIKSRQGTNVDTQAVTPAPSVPAYANNGGATGDLVFALNNLRHGGMM